MQQNGAGGFLGLLSASYCILLRLKVSPVWFPGPPPLRRGVPGPPKGDIRETVCSMTSSSPLPCQG